VQRLRCQVGGVYAVEAGANLFKQDIDRRSATMTILQKPDVLSVLLGLGSAMVYPTLQAAIADVANTGLARAVGVSVGGAIGVRRRRAPEGLIADLWGLTTAVWVVALRDQLLIATSSPWPRRRLLAGQAARPRRARRLHRGYGRSVADRNDSNGLRASTAPTMKTAVAR
jgi:hypothetical protein